MVDITHNLSWAPLEINAPFGQACSTLSSGALSIVWIFFPIYVCAHFLQLLPNLVGSCIMGALSRVALLSGASPEKPVLVRRTQVMYIHIILAYLSPLSLCGSLFH